MDLPAVGVGRALGAAFAQSIGQRGKALGGGLGDIAAGLLGAKALGVGPQPAQQGLLFGLIQLVQRHAVHFGRMAVELGVDADDQPVAHHQQRRVVERQAVTQQLFERLVQVAAGGLVFPGKVVAHKHVRITTRGTQDQGVLLKEVVAAAAGCGHAEQLAQVDKVRLRTLALVQGIGRSTRSPFGDEFLWRHGPRIQQRTSLPVPHPCSLQTRSVQPLYSCDQAPQHSDLRTARRMQRIGGVRRLGMHRLHIHMRLDPQTRGRKGPQQFGA